MNRLLRRYNIWGIILMTDSILPFGTLRFDPMRKSHLFMRGHDGCIMVRKGGRQPSARIKNESLM